MMTKKYFFVCALGQDFFHVVSLETPFQPPSMVCHHSLHTLQLTILNGPLVAAFHALLCAPVP